MKRGKENMDMKKAILLMAVVMLVLPMVSAAIESTGNDYYSEGGGGTGGTGGTGTTPAQPPPAGGTIGGAGKPGSPAGGVLPTGGSSASMKTSIQSTATTNPQQNIKNAVCQLYDIIQTALPAIIFLMIVLAAAIYGAGQIMSAEMRSRASVWANSLIIGAVFGILIWIVVPAVLNTLLGSGTSITSACA